jgi:hypothetical protein
MGDYCKEVQKLARMCYALHGDHPWCDGDGLIHVHLTAESSGMLALLACAQHKFPPKRGNFVKSMYIASIHWPAAVLAAYRNSRPTPLPPDAVRRFYGVFAESLMQDPNNSYWHLLRSKHVRGGSERAEAGVSEESEEAVERPPLYMQAPIIPLDYLVGILKPENVHIATGNPIFEGLSSRTAVAAQLESEEGIRATAGGTN